MRRRIRLLSALAAATLAVAVGTSTAHAAILTDTQYPCQVAIAKEGLKFVQGKLKLQQKCINSSLIAEQACSAEALTKLRSKLRAGLAKKCTFLFNNSDRTPTNLASIGFPGPCANPVTTDGFTLLDLQNCIENSHEAIIAGGCAGGSNAGQVCTTVLDCPDQSAGTFCRRGLGGCWGGANTGEACAVLADCPDQSAGTTGCRLALGMKAVEYDPTFPTLSDTQLKCQKAIAKNSATFVTAVLKAVQKCRNDLLKCTTDPGPPIITNCKLSGLLPKNCATDLGPDLDPDPTATKFANQKTIDAIAKARAKANAAIAKNCPDTDVPAIKACDPDQSTGALAARCELDSHQALTDNPYPTAPPDFLDYEYPQRGFCGNNQKDQPSEECDGVDDSACPGLCGAASGLFPCLCQDSSHKRERVVEHANSDLDNGWTGQSHDSGIVEGGGYVTDLWDCDGPDGPDTICNVGPSCSGGSHSPCSPQGFPKPTDLPPPASDTGNEICASLGEGTCRKTEGGATGPHCELDFQQRCINDLQCKTIAGDRCVFVPHGAPLPISSGGVSVCVVNIFSEDVVGTTNLSLTAGPGPGSGAVRLRQNSSTYLGPDQEQPCPVCGGFCTGSAGATTPGTRNLCANDGDCTPPATCNTDPVCGWGPNMDKACRPNTPFGGTTEFFGNPSVDCPMAGLLLGTIDILFNPATTGDAAPITTNIDCDTDGWRGKVCVGGSNQHAACTVCVGGPNANAACEVASQCPGGSCAENSGLCSGGGTCNEQCFCGGGPQKPNACDPACLGGTNNAAPCAVDSECPGSFCHPGDCRLNLSDTDSSQEGLCTVGPFDGRCSVHTFKTCTDDAGCGGGICPFCDPGETCLQVKRECFVNPTETRAGKPAVAGPNPDDRTTAATFCISKTTSEAVNATAGLPGPGAITTTETITEAGF